MLSYHQFRGRLGQGDLHPGGSVATLQLLHALHARGVQRVLEVGAGIGLTAARLLERGFEVTALEPDPLLYRTLQARLGSRARPECLLEHAPAQPYDAVVAESVLALNDLTASLEHIARLLRPAGLLAFIEAVWTDRVSPGEARAWHERTLRLFGIAVGSAERLTWTDWCRCLEAAGFRSELCMRLRAGAAGHPPTRDRPATLRAVLARPQLLLSAARFRLRKRRVRIPPGGLESWLYVGRLHPEARGLSTIRK